ncbi:sigma 54-interacting transcriptional regulator [bacterium]|nr:MAG: sigma 54-interacting transcriptional regulator [bacterium]QQR61542.1 MAG: sigma 54-interacting transcriptional regulator [bacterium]
MNHLVYLFKELVKPSSLLLIAHALGLGGKMYLFFKIHDYSKRLDHGIYLLTILLISIFSGIYIDTHGVINQLYHCKILTTPQTLSTFFTKFCLFFCLLHYHSIMLLLKNLLTKKPRSLLKTHILPNFVSGFFGIYFILSAVMNSDNTMQTKTTYIEYVIHNLYASYIMCFIIPYTIWTTFNHLRNATTNVPLAIQNRTRNLLIYFYIPYVISDFINMNLLHEKSFYFIISYPLFIVLASLILTAFFYYCTRYIVNIPVFPYTKETYSLFNDQTFNNNFKETLINLSTAANEYEILQYTREFISKALGVSYNKIHLLVKPVEAEQDNMISVLAKKIKRTTSIDSFKNYTNRTYFIIQEIEKFTDQNRLLVLTALKKHKIIEYHEIDFANFYFQNDFFQKMIEILHRINSEAIIPVFEKNQIIAYIILDRNSKSGQFFDETHKDVITVFSNYLAGIICSFQARQLTYHTEKEHMFMERILKSEQEVDILKESIKAFIEPQEVREVGVFLYKNKLFTACNRFTTTFTNVDLNMDQGHTITKECKKLIAQVIEQKSVLSKVIQTEQNSHGILAIGIPHIDQKQVIMILSKPNLSDVLNKQLLSMPSTQDWHYFLYLQSTKVGNLLHTFFPLNTTEGIIKKIHILKNMLNSRVFFLGCPHTDALIVAKLIHESKKNREFKQFNPMRYADYEAVLFGTHTSYNMLPKAGLLETLDNGTIFIENITYLNIPTQQKLYTYIQTGAFTKINSNVQVKSNVQIILHTPLSYDALETIKDSFLYTTCKTHYFWLPTLESLTESDYYALVDAYMHQIRQAKGHTGLLPLSESQKRKLHLHKPLSITDLRHQILSLMLQNDGKPAPTITETEEKPAIPAAVAATDLAIQEAKKLGKKALKDRRTLALLWQRFNKNQNRIAHYLGVNRSSVSRRIKKHRMDI